MSEPQALTLTFDRRLLEHPRAYHLRRMRVAIWLYLDLLARLPAGTESIEVEPATIGRDMGLPEGTIRSWLGHLRKAGYLEAKRLNGASRVVVKGIAEASAESSQPLAPGRRFFTVAKLQRALGEKEQKEALQAALNLYPDRIIKRALAGALAVPEQRIRRSRTALFLYLVKHHAEET